MINLFNKSLLIKFFAVLFVLPFLKSSDIQAQCPANAEYSYYIITCNEYQFTDMSTVSNPNYTIIAWYWDFDDGGSSNAQNPTHTFTPGHTYNVKLTVTADSSGSSCKDSVVHRIVVDDLPTVTFTWDPDPTCLGDPTSFFGSSSGNIVQWQWEFGDGGTSTIQNPIHLYVNSGTYDVTVTVTDVNGCVATHTDQVEIVEVPDVDFTVNPNPTCINSPTFFSGSSSGNIVAWEWDFGDGFSGHKQNVTHSYSKTGTFDVTLKVTSADGCSNSITKQLRVNALPEPDFEHNAPVCFGDTIFFDDLSTTPNGYITTWEWKFGDGTTTIINYPDDPNTSHLYPLENTYEVTLVVTDSDGCIDSISKSVEVVYNPVANFHYSNPCDGDPVDFTDASSQNNGSPIISWYWNFGDPLSGILNTSTEQNPTHLFTSADTFNVTLVIINLDGCSDTMVKQVIVNSPENVDFTADRDTACVNEIIQFSGIGDNIVSWYWEFGDGGTDIIQNPEYAYNIAGTYDVTLTVVDINGCSNSITHPVNVKDLPIALFNVSTPTCTYDTVYFTDYSTSPSGYITTWHWYFGDGQDTVINYPDDPNIGHLYVNPSTYAVKLVVTDSYGCMDSTTTNVTLIASPIANFDYSSACYKEPVEFTDKSLPNGGGNIVNWYWDFGDPLSGINNFSTLQNPTHIFTDSGTYIVSLTVFNANGCFDTTKKEVLVRPLPNVDFTVDNDSTCVGSVTYFYGEGDSIVSWYWEFGDGGTASSQNTQHIYYEPGIYTVTLYVVDQFGCSNSVSHDVLVNEQPFAQFTYANNCYTDTTYFTDQSFSSNSVIKSWFWDFDDPASSPNDTSTLQNPTHIFSDAGTYNVKLRVTDLNGCVDSIVHQVQVFTKPIPLFSYDIVCEPHGTVYFYDESVPGGSGSIINDWFWEIDENYYSTEQNPHYTYTITDTCYAVTLTVTDLNHCSSSYTDTVCILDPLEVDFTANRVCYTKPTHFDASYLPDDDSVKSWKWEFGDGKPPVTTAFDTISYTYSNPGTYQVVLTAKNINNCTATAHHTVIVDALPLPDFSYDDAICNEPTQFHDSSSGNGTEIQSWYWNFGDISSGGNNFSTQQNPSHVYPPNDSTYYVTLQVTNQNGCIDSITKPVIKNPCIVALFDLSSDTLCSGDYTCFTDSSYIYQNAGNIIDWQWDFGDGNSYNYSSFQPTICHVYENPGNYSVTLTITGRVNNNNFTDSQTLKIYVNPSPTADFINSPACNNTYISFTDESAENGLPIVSWYWDFGNILIDTDTSTQQNPTYFYDKAGEYDVGLIVTNNEGCRDTIIQNLDIHNRPSAEFSFEGPCLNNPTFFYDESDSSDIAIQQWYWDFGNPNTEADTSIKQNPSYNYKQIGNYNVNLIITDKNECIDTIIKSLQIIEPPISAFTIEENVEGIQGQVMFENLSINSTYYYWDFGNGDTSYLDEPVITYHKNGTYTIQLIAYNDNNCSDTTYLDYEVFLKGLYIPNAFAPLSPNPDVKLFKPKGYNIKSYNIEVYSKWGNLLWSSTKLDSEGRPVEGWDGKYEGELMPQGAYIWKAKALFKDNTFWDGNNIGDGNSKTYGTVNLIH